MFSFNLIEEKWLPCVMPDNSLQDSSLRDILTNAPSIKELVGDSPPVTIALHRLLLAILHRALNAPQTYEDWSDYWQAKSWNEDGKLDKYLADWKHRFDLFDERRPFFQASYLKDYLKKGEVITLYFHNSSTLFEHSNRFNASLSAPAVARLLVGFQSFDVGGLKTYIEKADKSANASPLIQSAVALIRGQNLFETLMLNWHQYNENDEQPFKFRYAEDLPAWEKETEIKAGERYPAGYVDLLTWQSRCILLQPENNESGETIVSNGVVMKGFQFPGDFVRKDKETMVTFVKKDDKSPFLPLRFNTDKALWRDSLAILKTISEKQSRPKIFDWLNELVSENIFERSGVFPVEFYGLSADQAKLLFWRQDKFNLPLAYLDDNELLKNLETGIQFAENTAGVLKFALKVLAEKLETDANNFSAMSIYWASLETRFQKLLSALPSEKETAMRDWFGFVDETAKHAFSDTANSLSGSAIEQKAMVEAESSFYRTRAKLLKENSIYREFLPDYKTKGEIK